MKEFIIFYSDIPILFYNGTRFTSTALKIFEYDKKYKVLERFDTSDWEKNHLSIDLNGVPIQIVYRCDSSRMPYPQNSERRIIDGLLEEFSPFPDYDIIDIQTHRDELLDKILNDIL
jgi:hypothetical protein